MLDISPVVLIIFAIVLVLLIAYLVCFFIFKKQVHAVENRIISTFLLKVSKIPALIEVMRPQVVDELAFDTLIKLHTTVMIHKYETIYILLEHNARIHEEFLFLMKLSMQIPDLQKNEQFMYIREFIMLYEKNIKKDFSSFNEKITKWNRFVTVKNMTLIGFLLPWKKKDFI